MTHTQLLGLAALALAAAAPAEAQARRESPDRATEPVLAPRARTFSYRVGDEQGPRAALGVGTSSTGTLRDTLGLLITSVTPGGPAEKAGLEEGNRLSAINGVSLRASAADIEDYESSGALSRRLVRELTKVKPGDEVELRVHRDGRTQAIKVRTADSDSLFRRRATFARVSRSDMEDRPALGIGIGSSGSRRDTLGVLIISVQDSTPAARAGLEEGNRIAAINGVNLRVAHEDAGDASVGHAKAQRLQREVARLKPNDNVTLRVYANGQFRDVTMKVARAGDLPRRSRMGMAGPGWFFPGMPPEVPLPPGGLREMNDVSPIRFEIGPELRERMKDVRVELDRIGPEIQKKLGPELEKLRLEVPRMLEEVRIPNVRVRLDGPGAEMEL
ncbi:MAG: hypothetical protein JWL95_1208 [Gemmatimonadetes bacterium]|nr:hypothetical protein [Gemmatimonadota bacterium]